MACRYRDQGLTVWSPGQGDRIPIRGALPQGWAERIVARGPTDALLVELREPDEFPASILII
jgi:hypothetical protein